VPLAAEKSTSAPEPSGTAFSSQFAASFHDPPLVPFQVKVSAQAPDATAKPMHTKSFVFMPL
jgi:hypothetical protein